MRLEAAREVTLVEWVLRPGKDGGTTLHLAETGFRGPTKFDDNSSGWGEMLPKLQEQVERRQD